MRNLKKFLALVLAMMMVFGLMVTANAADTTDDAEAPLKYQQALEIIAELKVLRGHTGDGSSLDPNGALTRGQLAAVLYRMYTGNVTEEQENADILLSTVKDTKVFDDVDPTNESVKWAVGYVNYAYQKGWLKGYAGSNKFGPNDTLTVLQALTGILRVLGLEDTSNSNWEMATLEAAEKAKLIEGFTYAELKGGASRQQLSQLALEGLTHPTKNVEKWYVTRISDKLDIDKISNPYDSEPLAIEAGLKAKAADAEGSVALNVDFTVTPKMEDDNTSTLGNKVFGLLKSDAGTDEYGRPATVYTVGDEVISSVEKKAVLEKDMPFTGAELHKELGNATITVTKVNCAVEYTTIKAGEEYKTVTGSGSSAKVNTATFGANGVHVEIYEGSEDGKYVAVVNVPTFTQITKIKEEKASVTVGAHTDYTLKGIGTLSEYTTSVDAENEKTNIDIYDGAEEEDFVMVEFVPKADDEHWDCYIVTPVDTIEGKVPSYTSKTKTWTVGSTGYLESAIANASGLNMSTDSSTRIVAVDSEENVIALLPKDDGTEDEEIINYLFVLNASVEEYVVNGKIQRALEVDGITDAGKFVTGYQIGTLVVTMPTYDDGELTTIPVNNDFLATEGVREAMDELLELTVFAYEYEDGKYTLTEVTFGAAAEDDSIVYANTAAGGDSTFITDGDDTLIDGTLYASTKTKYYVGVYDETEEKYVDVTPYTGHAAIGDVEATNIVAIDRDGDGIADVVFMNSTTPVTSETYAYILKDYDIGTGTNKYIYTAIIDGKETELKLAAPITDITLPALVVLDGTDYELLADSDHESLDAFGTVADTKEGLSNYITLGNVDKLSYNGGWLMADKNEDAGRDTNKRLMRIDATLPVYIFKAGTVSVKTAADLSGQKGATIVIATNDSDETGESANGTKIVAIYIVEDAVVSVNGTVTGEKTVDKVQKGQTVTVTGDASLESENGYEEGSNVTTDDVTKVKKGEDATCDEAIGFEGEEADPKDAQDGMIFKTEDGDSFKNEDGEAYSKEGRTEFSFTFTVPVAEDGTDVTITLTHRTSGRVLKDKATEVTKGKHFWLVCPYELNDGDTNHNNFCEGSSTTPILKSNTAKNKLDVGYWTVSIDTKDGTNLFKGGFTITAEDLQTE